jgi:NhaP-type Na+/H+ or K+/H+ antiporter
VGLLAIGALELVRRKTGVRRDYESLYSLGVAFAAYASAEAVHGSGFLAAFCAGLTITALDVELCDCFLEYGQTTAEMTLLFTFILSGSSLIWQVLLVLNVTTVLFAVTVVLIRPIALLLSLSRTNLERRSCFLIAWFGPRGLSSLLLILVPVFAAVPGSEQLFVVCCLVVLLSVALHGGSLMLLSRTPTPTPVNANQIEKATPRANDGAASVTAAENDSDRISIQELRALRMPADQIVRRIAELNVPRDTWIITFCA